jgi:mitogen-activated protein kinase 1/3
VFIFTTSSSALDTVTQERVAIKKINNVFSQGTEYAKRILREVKVLKHFRHHDNIICLKSLILPRSFEEFNDVYIVTDLMDDSLKGFLSKQVELTEQQIQFLMYQLLRSLKYIHSANVLHRDIKPHNILINYNCELKVCDFGLARGMDSANTKDEQRNMSTHYVASRWYRAPELLLCHKEASKSIDMWSVGCVFSELLNSDATTSNRVLFPGDSYLKQIDLIINLLGSPLDEDIRGCAKGINYVKTRPKKEKQDLRQRFPRASSLALDLLEKMLHFNPDKRITIDEALQHPYLESMSDPETEPVSETQFKFELPNTVTLDELKKLMYEEIAYFDPEAEDRMMIDDDVTPEVEAM